MKDQDLVPPATSDPANNPNSDMIDAQLTTEIFGLLAPGAARHCARDGAPACPYNSKRRGS